MTDPTTPPPPPQVDVIEEQFSSEFILDANLLQEDRTLKPVGNVLRLGNNFYFLSTLSDEQLTELKDAVAHAVTVELSKRL